MRIKKVSGAVPASNIVNNFSESTANAYSCNYIDNLLTNIAPNYDNTDTYAVGDYVMYEGTLYECNTAVIVAEDFDSTKWTQTTLAELLGNIKTLLGGI